MPTPSQPARRSLSSVLVSLALHGALVALAFVVVRIHPTRVAQPAAPQKYDLLEIAGGAHAIPVPLPKADFAAKNPRPTPEMSASRKSIVPTTVAQKTTAGGGTPPDPHHGDGTGPAARGSGSDAHTVIPTFPVFSPRPPISDRALLPATESKIIVNVDVDASGNVTRETLVQGISDPLNKLVLDIVPTWRFQPATVDGKPVASTAELVFPFDQHYPITAT
ncbi:MAG: energy transducer TonB [Acidobacteriota bacterium]|nr:energy transducer TonB [Acidobacteriota bacterium]